MFGLGGGGVRVDVNKELKLFVKILKKLGGVRGDVRLEGSGLGGSGWM